MPIHEIAVAIFLLVSLTAVAALRRILIQGDAESYRNIAAGLVILNTASLLRFYYLQSIFARLPFLSEPLFFELVYWTFVVTGSILLVSGVTSWLPIARHNRKQYAERVSRLELIRKVRQLIRVESRVPIVLEKTLGYMINDYGFKRGAVYAVSHSKQSVRLISSASTSSQENDTFSKVQLDYAAVVEAARSGRLIPTVVCNKMPEGAECPREIVPVLVGPKPAALFLLWSAEASSVGDDDRTNLRITADIIADKITSDLSRSTAQISARLEQWRERTATIMNGSSDLRSALQVIAEELRPVISFDLMQLLAKFKDGSMERHTVGENMALLSEKNLTAEEEWEALCQLQSHDKVTRFDVNHHSELECCPIVGGGQVQRGMLISIGARDQDNAILMISTDQTGQPRSIELKYAQLLGDLMSGPLARECARREVAAISARTNRLERFLLSACREEIKGDLFVKAAEFVSRELKTDAVRIVTQDAEDGFLSSRALVMNSAEPGVIPANGALILALMPATTAMFESARTIMIDQDDPECTISLAEAKQLISENLRTGLMVPIVVRGRVVGAIIAATVTSSNVNEASDRDHHMLQMVSSVLSLRLETSLSRVRRERIDDRHNLIGMNESEIRNRIKSSLAGIVGSVEFIREKNPETVTGSIEKCLSIIDRSAKRLAEYVTS